MEEFIIKLASKYKSQKFKFQVQEGQEVKNLSKVECNEISEKILT